MTVLLTEDFEGDWTNDWGGQPRFGYPANQGSDPDKEARLLIREGEHYGSDYRKPFPRSRKGSLSYGLYLSGDWNPDGDTGKLPGVLDGQFEPAGYGNNKPSPDGGSVRTWFGPDRTIGLYTYHDGQGQAWGDSVTAATVPLWTWVIPKIDWDLDEGWVSMTVRDKVTGTILGSASQLVSVSDATAFDVAMLCAYYGGSAVAPANMAADVDDYKIESVDETPPPPSWMAADADTLRQIAGRLENGV